MIMIDHVLGVVLQAEALRSLFGHVQGETGLIEIDPLISYIVAAYRKHVIVCFLCYEE